MITIFLKDIRTRLSKMFTIFFSMMLMAILTYTALDVQSEIVKVLVDKETSIYKQVDGILTSKDSRSMLDRNTIDSKDYKDILPLMYANGYIDSKKQHVVSQVYGVDFELANQFGNEVLENKDNVVQGDNVCYLSKKFAEKYHFSIGEVIPIHFGEQVIDFKLCGYGKEGLFLTDTKPVFFVNQDVLQKLSGINENQYTQALVKLKQGEKFKEVAKKVNTSNNYTYKITQVCDRETIQSETSNLVMPLQLITIIALIIGIFIIFSNYKIVLLERQTFFGTLKILGLGLHSIMRYLLEELLIIMGIASTIGILLGCMLSRTLSNMFSDGETGNGIFSFQPQYVLATFIIMFFIAVLLFASSCRKLKKSTTRELIFSDVKGTQKHSYIKDIICSVLFLIGVLFGQMNQTTLMILGVIIMIAAGLQLVPIIFIAFNKIIKKISYRISSRSYFISSSELEGLNIYHFNAMIAVLCIIIICSVSGLSAALGSLLGEAYDTFQTDIFVEDLNQQNYPSIIRSVDSDANTKSYYEYFATSGTLEDTLQISSIQGINRDTFRDFNNFYDIKDADYNDLKKDKYILVTKSALKTVHKQVGDKIEVNINDVTKEYRILGTFDPNGDAMGSVALISDQNMKNDFLVSVPRFLCIKLKNTSGSSVKELKTKLSDNLCTVLTKSEKQGEQQDMVDMIIQVINIFSYVVILAGIFGMFGNLYIAEIQKNRINAIYKTLGVVKGYRRSINLVQNAIFVVESGLIGAGITVILMQCLNRVLHSMNLNYKMVFVPQVFGIGLVEVFVLLYITKLMIQHKFRKNSILDVLKCD